jgi:hypothetical protein
MNPIKHYLLDILNNRTNRKNQIPHLNTSFREAREFGLLFTWENEAKYTQVKEVVKFLEIHSKSAEMLCYVKTNKMNFAAELPVFFDKDISLFGKIKSKTVEEFISKPYDFLWHLDLDRNTMIQYILSRTHARCRIGKADPESQQFYEMMIASNNGNDFKDLCDQVLHYTKSITTYA